MARGNLGKVARGGDDSMPPRCEILKRIADPPPKDAEERTDSRRPPVQRR